MPRSQVRRARRVVVKVGSALLAPGGELDRKFIGGLARQVATLVSAGREVLLVTSGAISAGLKPLGLSGRPNELPLLQAAAAAGQGQLMHAYQIAFSRCDLVAAQILITRDALDERERYLNVRNTIRALLGRRAVPVINENDTVSVEEIRFGDNDLLSALVASLAEADLLILLTGVAGLLDGEGRVVPTVEEISPEVSALVRSDRSAEGTGGMGSKLAAARIGQKSAFHTVIAPGREPDVIARIMDGEEIGTLIKAGGEKLLARKRWLAFGQRPAGRIVVDDGAAKALVERKKSLLAIGVAAVEGGFAAGESVSIVTKRGRELARGISNYSAADVERIRGRRTDELASIVGEVRFEEVVHRDNLTML
ncbi:MAG TPA: glutamate 5-kinase [Planctomycetota bacterium]|nr:glutamate 5-kinase [Planctomycetota bacterium]